MACGELSGAYARRVSSSRVVPLETGRLAQDCEEVATSMRWPLPFDRRLTQLVQLAHEAGAGAPDRKWLLAALVLNAPEDGEQLAALLTEARRARVKSVILGVGEDDNVVSVPRNPVGRPRRVADQSIEHP